MGTAPTVVTARRWPQWALTPLAVLVQVALMFWHRLRGYTRPGTRPETDPVGAAEYDRRIVSAWLDSLAQYTGRESPVRGLDVLELGPGPDLGAGLFLLAEGAATYSAVDVNYLISRASEPLYEAVLSSIASSHGANSAARLGDELERFGRGGSEVISYRCLPGFDLSRLGENTADLVVSQAAFEHFRDPVRTVAELAAIVRPGGIFLARVDLKTHTPLVRDLDPLSIYRLPGWLYEALQYPGCPNRLRPHQYVQALNNSGWTDIVVTPTKVVSEELLLRTWPHLAAPFRRERAAMSYLSIQIMARR